MKYDYHEEYNLRFQEGIINLILLKINREDLNKQIVLYKNEICRKCKATKIENYNYMPAWNTCRY